MYYLQKKHVNQWKFWTVSYPHCYFY